MANASLKRIIKNAAFKKHLRKEIRKILNEPEPKPRLDVCLRLVGDLFEGVNRLHNEGNPT